MKKKIFIYQYSLDIGGIERSLIGLLNSIDYKEYEVDLFLVKHEGEFLSMIPREVNILKEEKICTLLGVPIKELLLTGKIKVAIIRLWSRVCYFIREKLLKKNVSGEYISQIVYPKIVRILPLRYKKYDIALSFCWPHYYVINNVVADIKVGWIHTDYSRIYPDLNREKDMWNELNYIACVSEDCKKEFISKFPDLEYKTLVIENILSSKFIKEQANKIDTTSEIQSSKNIINLCSVGRFCKAKNFESIPNICRRLKDSGLDIKWYIIGYGSFEKLIKSKIHEFNVEDSVIILGKKKNPYPYIKACDLYIQPSRFEGKAVTVREAQILGKPVIITNFPTASSQVKDKYDGVIVPMELDECINAIKNTIENKELVNKIINNISKEEFGNENEINKIYDLIYGD